MRKQSRQTYYVSSLHSVTEEESEKLGFGVRVKWAVGTRNGFIYYTVTCDGICYRAEMPTTVVTVLERARQNNTRIKIHYGDVNTGQDFLYENDTTGIVTFSTGGKIQVALLAFNRRSNGGGEISPNIVKITTANGGDVLYVHPQYWHDEISITPAAIEGYKASVMIARSVYANCKTESEAHRLVARLLR